LSAFEIIAAVITAYSVWLTAKENIWCWPIGFAGCAMYIAIFWQARLYANAVLQVLYLAMIVYGWFQWRRGGAGHSALRVTRTPLSGWLVSIAGGVALTLAIVFAMTRWTAAAMPWPDASTTAFSIVAEWMTARKWIENWIVWIVVDAVTTWMLAVQHLYASAVLYAAFVVLAAIGWIEWRKSLASA
jgi:nicotinamide mononucleotide transporter